MADRRKYNMEGVLRMALEQSESKNEDGNEFQEMSVESKRFLENALKSMTVDVVEQFKKALSTLEDPLSSNESKLDSICIIREHIDSIDFANDFVKLGGSDLIMRYVKHDEKKIRMNAIYIVAEMSQNNPFCQKHFLEAKVLPLFISYFQDEEDIAGSALHAVSSLVRNFEPGLIEFIRIGGVETLLSCLNTSYSRVFIKTCFLIACLSSENHFVRDKFVLKAAVTKLLPSLEPTSGFDIKIETVLFALADLSKSPQWKPDEVTKEKVRSILTKIIEENKNYAQCEEMVLYSNSILKNIEEK